MTQSQKYLLVSLAWLAAAVGFPVLVARGAAALARRSAKRAAWWRVGGVLATLATLLTLSSFALAMAVCAGPPPGESDAARELKARSAPVVAALAAYRAAEGRYPATLEALVPRYLPPARLPRPRIDGLLPLEYLTSDTGYVLRFEYTGPGRNHCEYDRRGAAWRCHGYF